MPGTQHAFGKINLSNRHVFHWESHIKKFKYGVTDDAIMQGQ